MFTDLSKKNDEERLNSSYGKKLKDNQLRLNSPVSTLSQMKNIPKIDTMFNRTKNFSLKESKADRVMAKNFKF